MLSSIHRVLVLACFSLLAAAQQATTQVDPVQGLHRSFAHPPDDSIVGNTAINELAGQSLPDYRLLYAKYGVEFIPQGMDNLKPLPSGILGHVSLIADNPK